MTASENKLVVFKGKSIRRTLHQNEWWFVVTDVVEKKGVKYPVD